MGHSLGNGDRTLQRNSLAPWADPEAAWIAATLAVHSSPGIESC